MIPGGGRPLAWGRTQTVPEKMIGSAKLSLCLPRERADCGGGKRIFLRVASYSYPTQYSTHGVHVTTDRCEPKHL